LWVQGLWEKVTGRFFGDDWRWWEAPPGAV